MLAFSVRQATPPCSTLSPGGRPVTLINALTSPDETSLSGTPAASDDLPNWLVAVRAAESKKGLDLRVLSLRDVTSFTDYFIICTSTNPRQGQAIADEIGKKLKQMGELPVSVEGFDTGEWILMDYGDFIAHIFSATARSYYDLERLWRHAQTVNIPAEDKS